MSTSPFYVDPQLTNVVRAYWPEGMIADAVLPRVTVGRNEYSYLTYTKEQAFTVPDTLVARKGNVPEIEIQSSRETGFVPNYAIDEFIAMEDYGNANGRDLNGDAATFSASMLALSREKRVADLVFAAGTYGSNTVGLSGNHRWDVSTHADSDPIPDIVDALDAMIMRGNVMVIGRKAWSYLQRHPKIVKSIFGTSTDAGIAPKEAVADLFELKEILVGTAQHSTAKKGQSAAMSRIWGNHVALIYRDSLAQVDRGITFGFSPTVSPPTASTYFDPKRGAQGSNVIRVADLVDEKIVAADLGYLLTDVVS